MTSIPSSGTGISQTQRISALPVAPAQAGLVLTSGDPTLGQGSSWQAPLSVPVAVPVIQALGNVTGTVTLAVAGAYVTEASLTMTGDTVLQITGMPAAGLVRISVTQDGTGNHAFAVGNVTTTTSVYVEQAAAFTSKVRVFSVDGGTMEIEGPSLVGRSFLLTASNATWPIPSPATKMTIAAVGSGGSGGGAGSPAAGVNQSGGSGGGPGFASIQENLDVSTISTLNVTIGATVSGGAGGVAGGNDGIGGGFGNPTTVTATNGISVTGRGGLKGVQSTAGATTATFVVYNAAAAGWANGGQPLMGGIAGASGAGGNGGPPTGLSPGGGGGGMSATATLGGGAGSPGTATAGGAGGAVLSGTTAGVNGTAATALGAGGGGGGGGANGGAGGNGGASGAGFAVLTVTEAASITLPNPSQSMIFDGRIASGASTQVVVSGSSVTLQGWAFIQAGLTNPSNGTPPNGNARVELLAPFGPWAAKTHKVFRLRHWNTDTNNKNGGQQSNPACAAASPGLLGNYALGQANWHVFFGFSLMFPDGTQRDDKAFPVTVPSWFQVFEDFGPPYTGGPPWALSLSNGQLLNRVNNPALTPTANYFYMMSNGPTIFNPYWASSASLLYGDSHKYDFVIEVGRSTAASTDAGATGGFLNMWVNGVRQTWYPGQSEGGANGALWTRANSGQTLLIATLQAGAGTGGFGNWDSYRAASQFALEGTKAAPLNNPAIDPITVYNYIVGIGTTYNSVDPAIN